MNEETKETLGMTVTTIGKDLLSALVSEIKLMPKSWPELSKDRQDDVIDRLRARVETNVKMAVHLLNSQGRVTIPADLEQFVSKDGVKVVFKVSPHAAGIVELMQATGKTCLLVVADADDHLLGMDEVTGEPDQRAFDLGHEYHDNDGGGMEQSPEADQLGLPSPDKAKPSTNELEQAWDDGYEAAEGGKPESDCPIIRSELVAEWIRGWKAWHEENGEQAA